MIEYVLPGTTVPIPNKLTLTQFIQTVFVGITGIPGPLVRPEWQPEMPKQPDIQINWMALGITVAAPDANGYSGTNEDDEYVYQRHETLEIACAIYGPQALENYGLIRDGFQIFQNLAALRTANMGFVEVGPARKLPELINGRWINRVQTSVFLRREVQRTYPIPTLLSANGTIFTVLGNEDYLLEWGTQN
jgi:hypothetical protein